MNRFKILGSIYIIIIIWCTFFSGSTYINVVVITFASLAMMLGYGYIHKNMRENELRFFNKYINII